MKNKFIVLTIIATVLFTACNENDTPVIDLPDAEVSINTVLQSTSGEDLSKSGTYDRGGAPVYVAGVNISAVHNDYDYPVNREYLFVNEGETGEDVTMTVKAGSNTFNATSIATNEPFSDIVDDMDRSAVAEIEERVKDYAEQLKESKPIFVTYTATPVTQDILLNQTNTVELDMTADQGRVTIVFDTEIELSFSITAILYNADDNLLETQVIFFEDKDKACAIIFNRDDMTEGSYIDITITKNASPVITNEQIVSETSIDVKVGENYTHLYNYNGTETTDAMFNITFDPVEDTNSGVEITE